MTFFTQNELLDAILEITTGGDYTYQVIEVFELTDWCTEEGIYDSREYLFKIN
jgi:hypothetical protein